MEMSSMMAWNVLLTLVIGPAFFIVRSMLAEIKRIDVLLNKTREQMATRAELKEDMHQVLQALHRVEDKLDRALGRQ
jgi:hypothetical protein